MTLRDLFHQVLRHPVPAWIILPADDTTWTPDTFVILAHPGADPDADDAENASPAHSANSIPSPADPPRAPGLVETLDTLTLADCLRWADRLAGGTNDDARLESFRYYYRYDAFLPHLGAPAPPSPAEIQHLQDREFYDSLGAENSARPCHHPGCQRGSIEFSVLCRPHHFEALHRRPCPFMD